MKISISGGSGKTGFRIAEEAISSGFKPRILIRKQSIIPESINSSDKRIVDLSNSDSIDQALKGTDALVIATGARPSIDLTGPARIDACGVIQQIESCQRMGIKRVILVSSLCTGRLIHPLNLFGLILICKRFGEKALERSELNWTIIRPGGLNEKEEGTNLENVLYTSKDTQEEGYIPRRVVAKTCIEALQTENSGGKIIEITSSPNYEATSMKKSLERFNID